MDLLVIGASVRAASASLLRAGVKPVALDLYGDSDLSSTCESTRIRPDEYPSKIWERVRHLRPMPWIYTGAIENHPDLVEVISSRFRLLGNGPDALRQVRDPLRLSNIVRQAGFSAPEVRLSHQSLPTNGSWLEKPVASGGGEGIRPWMGAPGPRDVAVYYQAKVSGHSLAATFVRDVSKARLIGVTQQYLGRVGNSFAYRGSLGPWPMPETTRRQIEELGRVVGDSFGLLGLYGLDLIVDGAEPWLIEVNPRYTASVEVLERVLGRSIMADHLRAAESRASSWVEPDIPEPACQFAAKAILFAQRAGQLDRPITIETDDGMPLIADVPHVGTDFDVGHPIMTVFGRGDLVRSCQADLVRRLQSWKSRIDLARPSSDLAVDHQEHRHGDEQDPQDHPGEPERLDRDLAPGLVPRRRINAAHRDHERENEPVGRDAVRVDHEQ